MEYLSEYKRWCESETLSKELKDELLNLTNNTDIEDRFYRSLSFGTAGLRGILGAGTNRMNTPVVRQATKALADYINSIKDAAEKGVVIAYDSRNKSHEFALESALVLCRENIKVYLFSELHPVPMLSFTVKHLGCVAGIVITASHNPPEYNGYKVYWQDGGQITPERCEKITALRNEADPLKINSLSEQEAISKGLLTYIGKEIDEEYYKYTMSLCIRDELTPAQKEAVNITYSPLHGSGYVPVTELLSRLGYRNVAVVEEQSKPNGNFPTVKTPNPENAEAFALALELAKKQQSDIVIATDPDSDRLGVCARHNDGTYTQLTGNQIGTLLVHYMLTALSEKGKLEKGSCVVQSVVSTPLTQKICDRFGVSLVYVLTGFRYIAEHIEKCEKENAGNFLFGFEESYGFLSGTGVRDKDACLAACLVAEACAYYKANGKTLCDALNEIDEIYGAYTECGFSVTAQGKEAMEKLASYMAEAHSSPKKQIGQFKVLLCEDYEKGIAIKPETGKESPLALPKTNMIRYILEDAWVALRPSGTEPKLKVYVGANAKTRSEAVQKTNLIADIIKSDENLKF